MGTLCSHDEQNNSLKPKSIKKQSINISKKLNNENEAFGKDSSSFQEFNEQKRDDHEQNNDAHDQSKDNNEQKRDDHDQNKDNNEQNKDTSEPKKENNEQNKGNEVSKQGPNVENQSELIKSSESVEEAVLEKKKFLFVQYQNQLEISFPGKIFVETWWFCTLDWPPQKYDFNAELERRSLRKVELEDWESAPDIDQNGRRKVFEVPLHRGLFQDSQGRILDLKPRNECKAYQTLRTKSRSELLKLYQKAIEHEFKHFNERLEKMNEVFHSLEVAYKNSSENSKSHSHSSLFKTWWFWCLKWPTDSDYDWKKGLRISRWRVVSLNNWETETLRDENGFVKAFEVPLHPKVFENAFAGFLNCKPEGLADNNEELKSKSFYQLLKLYETAMRTSFDKFQKDYAELLSESIPLENIEGCS